jgi:spore germination protein
MARRWISIGLVCWLFFLSTGCWDRVEIEDRGFVIGIAIDMVKKKETEELAEQEAPKKPKGKERFILTYQFVVPGALQQGGGGSGGGGSGGGGSGGGGSGDAFLNISSEGDTMSEITREMATRTSRSPFIEHLKMIILSEEVAKSDQFANVLDLFLRDHEARRANKIMVSKGDARKVLEVKPKTEKLPVMYINSVAENVQKNARILPEARIGDVHEHLLKSESFTIPRITANDKEIKIAGSAVFHGHNNKMAGFLGEEETEGLNFITGEITGGILEISVQDNLAIYEIKDAKRSIKANVKDKDQIEFTISIESEGNVGESFASMDYLDPTVISTIEKKVENEIERLANDTIGKVHKDFQVDVLGLGEYLRQNHPDTWKVIKQDWDHGRNYFSKSTIGVEAKVKIRAIGTSNKTKR